MSIEKTDNAFQSLDGRKASVVDGHAISETVASLKDADEALDFLSNHPDGATILEQGQAILDDPAQYKKLLRKINWTICPLLAATYFLQFLDKTTVEPSSETQI